MSTDELPIEQDRLVIRLTGRRLHPDQPSFFRTKAGDPEVEAGCSATRLLLKGETSSSAGRKKEE